MKNTTIALIGTAALFSASAGAGTITLEQVKAAQQAWGDGIVEIGAAKTGGEDYRNTASDLIGRLYAYSAGPVAFKPTLAAKDQFRGTFSEAHSYFVGGSVSEDKGFAIRPWTNVRFENEEVIINGDQAIAMGNYYFTTENGDEVKVEYSFGYMLHNDELLINLHHSSMPFSAE